MQGRILSVVLLAFLAGGAYAAGAASSGSQAAAQPNFADRDRNDDGRLSGEELGSWDRQAFTAADTDGDGNLSEEEYGRAVATTGEEIGRPLPSKHD